MLSDETKIVRQNNLTFSTIDDEVIMMNALKGEYYGLNNTATVVWELLEKEISFKELIDKLLTKYNVNKATCLKEVEELLSHMKSKGLINMID